MNVSILVVTVRTVLCDGCVSINSFVYAVPDEKIDTEWRRILDQHHGFNIDSGPLREKFAAYQLTHPFSASYNTHVSRVYAFIDEGT